MEGQGNESRSDLNERAAANLSGMCLPMEPQPCIEEQRAFWGARCEGNAQASHLPWLKNLPAGFGYPRCRRRRG